MVLMKTASRAALNPWETDVDTPPRAPIKCFLEQGASARHREESAVTLIKIIIITLAVILSILFLGRFLF